FGTALAGMDGQNRIGSIVLAAEGQLELELVYALAQAFELAPHLLARGFVVLRLGQLMERCQILDLRGARIPRFGNLFKLAQPAQHLLRLGRIGPEVRPIRLCFKLLLLASLAGDVKGAPDTAGCAAPAQRAGCGDLQLQWSFCCPRAILAWNGEWLEAMRSIAGQPPAGGRQRCDRPRFSSRLRW